MEVAATKWRNCVSVVPNAYVRHVRHECMNRQSMYVRGTFLCQRIPSCKFLSVGIGNRTSCSIISFNIYKHLTILHVTILCR